MLIPSTASYRYRTRYYSEGSSRGNGEGALPSAGRTQLMTVLVTSQGWGVHYSGPSSRGRGESSVGLPEHSNRGRTGVGR
jgi:hypothetical protein